MAADVGQASACAGLQSRWRDSYERCGRRAKAPPQAEAWLKPAPHGLAGPTLARKCEVIPAPALSTRAIDTRQLRVIKEYPGFSGVSTWSVTPVTPPHAGCLSLFGRGAKLSRFSIQTKEFCM